MEVVEQTAISYAVVPISWARSAMAVDIPGHGHLGAFSKIFMAIPWTKAQAIAQRL
jgi:hypothetical protein